MDQPLWTNVVIGIDADLHGAQDKSKEYGVQILFPQSNPQERNLQVKDGGGDVRPWLGCGDPGA